MKTQTQLNFVKKHLLDNGKISRNYCLQNYISRLGARINDLREAGWEISSDFVKTEHGKDYVYTLVNAPVKKVAYRDPISKEVLAIAYE